MLQVIIQGFVDGFVNIGTDYLIPVMSIGLGFAVLFRFLIFLTIKREEWFAKEFAKRVNNFLDATDEKMMEISFYVTTKKLLEKTYYELFIIRSVMMRRKHDYVASLTDRMFLIQEGSARLVKDTLRQIKFLNFEAQRPQFLQISKNVFEHNTCFGKIFGVIPFGSINEILVILPGIFIIAGIFGTFLGIMKALPELGQIDIQDPIASKAIMDEFLVKISFAMSTSIVGIIYSVFLRVVNTTLSAERTFVKLVEQYQNSLDVIWNFATNNKVPLKDEEFDQNRDPIEALAENSIAEKTASADSRKSKSGGKLPKAG